MYPKSYEVNREMSWIRKALKFHAKMSYNTWFAYLAAICFYPKFDLQKAEPNVYQLGQIKKLKNTVVLRNLKTLISNFMPNYYLGSKQCSKFHVLLSYQSQKRSFCGENKGNYFISYFLGCWSKMMLLLHQKARRADEGPVQGEFWTL